MIVVRTAALLMLAANFIAAGTAPALAQYPDRPIRLLLPFPAGGAVDIVARVVTAKMSEDLGKPFVIENKAGAGGIIATDAVAKSPPDGYTLLLTTPNHTINAALQASLPYDTEKDLVPVALFAITPNVVVVTPALPIKSVKDLIAYAKAQPGKVNFGSAGIGTNSHLSGK